MAADVLWPGAARWRREPSGRAGQAPRGGGGRRAGLPRRPALSRMRCRAWRRASPPRLQPQL